MDGEKKCPPGKILNPVTRRCVKANGKIGKTLVIGEKKCGSGQILNPATGRCVKLDGKIGKLLVQQELVATRPVPVAKLVGIIFKPCLSILVNSSFDTGRSRSSMKRKHIWEKITIRKYIKWYNLFKWKIVDALRKDKMQFLGFSVHSKSQLLMKIKVVDPDTMINTLDKNNAIQFALNPDTDETNVVLYKNIVHLVECEEIKNIFLI
jgi:hypothetical protein